MFLPRIPSRASALRVLVLSAASFLSLPAGAADWQSLTGNSPFGHSVTVTEQQATPEDLEFRGVVQEEGVYLVNLFNPTTKTSQWIPVQGRAPGIEVGDYDAGTDKLQVTQGGRSLTLPLKQARVTLVQPTPPPAAPGAENTADAGRNADPRAGRPGSPGEQSPAIRNLPPEAQALVQEFRRRRAERAANQQQPPSARPRMMPAQGLPGPGQPTPAQPMQMPRQQP